MSENTRGLWIQQALPEEIWKPVPNYEGIYEASNLGNVRVVVSRKSIKAGHILGGYERPDGYRYIRLSKNASKIVIPIHRVILMTFDNRPDSDLYQVRHVNGDRRDNRPENLEWCTHSEATSHSIRRYKDPSQRKRTRAEVPFNLHPLSDEDFGKEEWRAIPQYTGIYEISNLGRVRSVVRRMRTRIGDIIEGSQFSIGYRYIRLTDRQGIKTRFLVHRLVLSTFNPIDGWESLDVNHRNADKSDNRLENLEWATRSQNILHAIHVTKTKKAIKGQDSTNTLLQDEDVRTIRRLYESGVTQTKLASHYGISQVAIHSIIHRKSWKHID